MMIPMLVITVKICVLPMFTTRIRRRGCRPTTAGTIGVLVRGWTFASRSPAGRLLSRAIANIIRIVAVWTARAQTVMAIATQIRKIFPTVLPSTSRMMNCSPPVSISAELMSLTARIANRRIRPPSRNEAFIARRIAFGAVRRGSSVSSPSELAVSKPYIT